MSTLPPRRPSPAPVQRSSPSSPSGQRDGLAGDFGPQNAWSALAGFLSSTAWYAGLHPRTQAGFDVRCKNIAVAFDAGKIASAGAITPGEIEAWINTQSRNDTVAASYHVVFGRLLRAARLQGQRAGDIEALRRLLRSPRPQPPRPDRRRKPGAPPEQEA